MIVHGDRRSDKGTDDAAAADPRGVRHLVVAPADDGVRLDRWFRRHCPTVPHSLLQRWLRSGQVRVDGRRAEAAQRVEAGQVVRIPPYDDAARPGSGPGGGVGAPPDPSAVAALRRAILYLDADLIVINKPAGLAVQGGSGVCQHLDGLLDGLELGGERPRLVHRLDRDTSGVLVLARSARAAADLAEAFRRREVAKLYWAVTLGGPQREEGRIDLPLAKRPGTRGEQVAVAPAAGDRAVTDYRVMARAGRRFTWLALRPLTGRTHQLRVHCASLAMPILGDGKYGVPVPPSPSLALGKGLHLHARTLVLPRPGGRPLTVTAPPPPHMVATFRALGFDEGTAADWPGEELAAGPRGAVLSRGHQHPKL